MSLRSQPRPRYGHPGTMPTSPQTGDCETGPSGLILSWEEHGKMLGNRGSLTYNIYIYIYIYKYIYIYVYILYITHGKMLGHLLHSPITLI